MNNFWRHRRGIMAVQNNTPSPISMAISSLTAGTELQIKEDGVYQPYIYLGLDAENHARALRKVPLSKRKIANANVSDYSLTTIDSWLEDTTSGYCARFDQPTLSCFVNTTISFLAYSAPGATAEYKTLSRKVFLPSKKEMGDGGSEAGYSYLPALKTYYNTSDTNTARASSVDNWMRTGWSNSTNLLMLAVLSGGSIYRYYTSSTTAAGVRPMLSIDSSTVVSVVNGVAYL